MICVLTITTAVKASQPSLDELLNLEPQRQTEVQKQTDEVPAPSDTAPIDREVDRLLSAEQTEDLFDQAMQEMRMVSQRLGDQRDAGLPTQRLQESILTKLDQLIADAEQRNQQSSGSPTSSSGQSQPQDQGSAGNAPPRPGSATPTGARATQPNSGTPSSGRVQRVTDVPSPLQQHRREWGNLPPRLREELIEGLNEPFSPVYRDLTRRYYRRLAEEAR